MSGITAFDLATQIGWAHADLGRPPMFGHYRPAPVGADEGQYFLAADRWMDAIITNVRPGIVYGESPWVGKNANTVARLYGLRAICGLVCARREVRLRWRTVAEVHGHFVGKGNRRPGEDKKQSTIRVCAERGWRVENSDEADALALLALAQHEISPTLAGTGSIGPLWRQEGAAND